MYVYIYFSNLLINFNLFPVVVWVHTTSMVSVSVRIYLPLCVSVPQKLQ